MDHTADSLPVPQDFDAPLPAAEAKPAATTPDPKAETVEEQAADEQVEQTDEADEQAADGDDEPTEEEVSDAARKLGKRGSPQARINKAVAKQRVAERQAEAFKRELDELRAGKTKHAAAEPTADEAKAAEQAKETAQYEKFAATFGKTPEDYPNYEQFAAAQAAHIAREVVKEDRQAESVRVEQDKATRAVDTVLANHATRVEDFRKRTPDFDAVMADAPDVTRTMFREMVESDAGPDIAYHLAQHPEEADRIASLPSKQQIKEIGKLEVQFAPKKSTETATADSGTARPKATKSTAPKPMKPVGGGAAASSVPLDQADPDEYIHRRNKDEIDRKRGGR